MPSAASNETALSQRAASKGLLIPLSRSDGTPCHHIMYEGKDLMPYVGHFIRGMDRESVLKVIDEKHHMTRAKQKDATVGKTIHSL